jgi:hypothetical protein
MLVYGFRSSAVTAFFLPEYGAAELVDKMAGVPRQCCGLEMSGSHYAVMRQNISEERRPKLRQKFKTLRFVYFNFKYFSLMNKYLLHNLITV